VRPATLLPPFRHIERRYPIETLRKTLQEGLLIPGHPDMPMFRFRREDVKPVIAYLLSIQKD
jgi:cytochrome c